MSAWDITGAIVWGFLTITGWPQLGSVKKEDRFIAVVICLLVTAPFTFCIARLFGAHL